MCLKNNSKKTGNFYTKGEILAWGGGKRQYVFCCSSSGKGGGNGSDPKYPRGKNRIDPVFPPGKELAWGKNGNITPAIYVYCIIICVFSVKTYMPIWLRGIFLYARFSCFRIHNCRYRWNLSESILRWFSLQRTSNTSC